MLTLTLNCWPPRPYRLGLGCFEDEKTPSLSWNSWFLTSKDEEVSRTDTSPFRIKMSFPCTNFLRLIIFKMDTFPINNEINKLVNTTFLLLRAADHSLIIDGFILFPVSLGNEPWHANCLARNLLQYHYYLEPQIYLRTIRSHLVTIGYIEPCTLARDADF